MNERNMLMFYDEDTGGTSGGAEGGGDFSQTATELYGGEAKGGDTTGGQSPDPASSTGGAGDSGDGTGGRQQVTPPAQLTPEQITAAVRAGVTPQQPEKEYTQDELDQMFKVYKPSEEVVTKLLAGGPQALEALVSIRDGLANQFGQLLKYQVELVKREFNDKYEPAVSFAQEQRAERERESFFKDNEELRNFPTQVDIAFKSLLGEGKKFANITEARKALADRAKQLIPNNNGSSSGTTQSSGAGTQQNTSRSTKPATLSTGGQAGGGGGSSAPPNVFHEIFGKQ